MKASVLMGSPRINGNTAALLGPFLEAWKAGGHSADVFRLYEMELSGCTACRSCQKDWTVFGCAIHDDMEQVFDSVLGADLILLACPIYSWYCTAPMKAALDRLMYGMNKFYGEEKGPSLWAGKRLAILTTCGYRPEKGADLFEAGMQRYCRHSGLIYDGMLAERDLGYKASFMNEEKARHARVFAEELQKRLLAGDRDDEQKHHI